MLKLEEVWKRMAGELVCESGLRWLRAKRTDMLKVYKTTWSI